MKGPHVDHECVDGPEGKKAGSKELAATGSKQVTQSLSEALWGLCGAWVTHTSMRRWAHSGRRRPICEPPGVLALQALLPALQPCSCLLLLWACKAVKPEEGPQILDTYLQKCDLNLMICGQMAIGRKLRSLTLNISVIFISSHLQPIQSL